MLTIFCCKKKQEIRLAGLGFSKSACDVIGLNRLAGFGFTTLLTALVFLTINTAKYVLFFLNKLLFTIIVHYEVTTKSTNYIH